jgi:cytochrome c oxidase cbb3-type subunit III
MKRTILCGVILLAACRQEERITNPRAAIAEAPVSDRQSALVAGPFLPLESGKNPFENNQFAISEGERLYKWFNCAGCHSPNGGGGIGPPLIDAHWIYGAEPANIYDTIVKGRPNGMPSFAGKIPGYQIWQLIAYLQMMAKDRPAEAGRQEKPL